MENELTVRVERPVIPGMSWNKDEVQKNLDELLAAYAKRRKAHVVVKGLRAVSDFEQEVQMAMINSKVNPELDTVFFPSDEKYTYLSSTVVKELARYHANLDEFLPREIIEDVKNKLELRSDDCDGSRQH